MISIAQILLESTNSCCSRVCFDALTRMRGAPILPRRGVRKQKDEDPQQNAKLVFAPKYYVVIIFVKYLCYLGLQYY